MAHADEATSAAARSADQREWVAVLGGAGRYTPAQIVAGYQVGRALARRGRHVMTGATTGIPYAAAVGAKEAGGRVLGISPACSPAEHVAQFHKPLDHTDVVIYTGMSVEGRSPVILRSVAGAVFIGGEVGTLSEFSAAWLCGGKVVGVLEGLGGITDRFRALADAVETRWGTDLVYDTDAESLAGRVCEAIDRRPPESHGLTPKQQDVHAILARHLNRGPR